MTSLKNYPDNYPKKPCKFCLVPKPKHWPFQCFYNPKGQTPIKRKGKVTAQWEYFRKYWIKANSGPYRCYLCGIPLNSKTVTLDHVLPRSRRPDLRLDESNIKPCCWNCNHKKGSRVYKVLESEQ
jgi:5-methylcytosine-specific restriction endonuclease McrA